MLNTTATQEIDYKLGGKIYNLIANLEEKQNNYWQVTSIDVTNTDIEMFKNIYIMDLGRIMPVIDHMRYVAEDSFLYG